MCGRSRPWRCGLSPPDEVAENPRRETRSSPVAPAPEAAGERASEQAARLSNVEIFKGLSPHQIGMVVTYGRQVTVPAGESLGEAGKRPENLYVILEGEARLSFHAEAGEVPVRIAGRGESFPLCVLLDSDSPITSGTALTDVRALSVPREALLELSSAHPEIGARLFRAVAQIFASRYRATLSQLAASAEKERRAP